MPWSPQMLAVLTALILLARAADFMLTPAAKRRLRETLVFRPWYRIESLSIHGAFLKAANRYEKIFSVSLSRPKTLRVFFARYATFMAFATALNYLILDTWFADHLQAPGPATPKPSLLVIQGLFMLAFASLWVVIVIMTANMIVRSVREKPRLWYGLVMSALYLWVAVTFAFIVGMMCSMPDYWREIRLPIEVASSNVTVPTIAPPTIAALFLPVVIYVLLFAHLVFMLLVERLRVVLAFVLERVDAEFESPISVLASLSSAAILMVSALSKL